MVLDIRLKPPLRAGDDQLLALKKWQRGFIERRIRHASHADLLKGNIALAAGPESERVVKFVRGRVKRCHNSLAVQSDPEKPFFQPWLLRHCALNVLCVFRSIRPTTGKLAGADGKITANRALFDGPALVRRISNSRGCKKRRFVVSSFHIPRL